MAQTVCEYDVRLHMNRIEAKWISADYDKRDIVADVLQYLRLKYDYREDQPRNFYRAIGLPAVRTWEENHVCAAHDAVHAMLLFEESDTYDFITTYFEGYYQHNGDEIGDALVDLENCWTSDAAEGPGIAQCTLVKPQAQHSFKKRKRDFCD